MQLNGAKIFIKASNILHKKINENILQELHKQQHKVGPGPE